jgi:phosphoribosylglycinamide formyltransferase 1
MINIAVFASGSGSNAQNIAEYFKDDANVSVSLILTNNKHALVIERAKKLGVECIIFDRDDFYNSQRIIVALNQRSIDLVVLAGFLWLVPVSLVEAFKGKIVNIHPALLPKYGGKGMYGQHVHQAVVANRESESGITIHFVNEHYDEGNIILQVKCCVDENDTADDVANKVHQLEYEHYPRAIAGLLNS